VRINIGNLCGRCLVRRANLVRAVYRLAARTEILPDDIEAHCLLEHEGFFITGACIFPSDFEDVRRKYGSLYPEEMEMLKAIGSFDFLIVLLRPSVITYLHEVSHVLYRYSTSFRQWALSQFAAVQDKTGMVSMIVQRGYPIEVLEEEIIAHAAAEFHSQPFMIASGNQGFSERLRNRVIAEIKQRSTNPKLRDGCAVLKG